jgi:Sulfotransferase family
MNYQLVGIHGAPRSGTSWLGQLFNSHEQVAYRFQPFFSYAFRGRIRASSDPVEICRLFDDLYETHDPFVIRSGDGTLTRELPEFEKVSPTHMVYKEVRFHDLMEPVLTAIPHAKLIGIVRDPLQVIESWIAAPREFKPEWSVTIEWRNAQSKNAGLPENWYGFERWKALAQLFLELEKRFPDRFTIVRYADLVNDTVGRIETLFRFIGLSPTNQTIGFIRDSTSRDDGDPYGVYRARRGERHRHLPDEIREAVCRDLTDSDLTRFMSCQP